MLKTLVKGCESTIGSKHSAGIDLYASEDVVIGAGETRIVGLGVCIDLEKLLYRVPKIVDMRRWHKKRFDAGITDVSEDESISHLENEFLSSHYLELHPRSSLRAKGLISNTCIIDLDYENEIKIIIHNPVTPMNIDYDNYDNEMNKFLKYEHIRSIDNLKIKKGDRIAQILLKEHKSYLFGVKNDEEHTDKFRSNK